MDLKTIESLVKTELETCERCRKDDMFLWYRICVKRSKRNISHISFGNIITNHEAFGLPNFETVRRTRQKVQKKFPYLKDDETVIRRAEAESDYLDYVRGGKGAE